MARYRIAKDGHRYLTHGYPVLDKRGQDDVRFSTYQVNTGAERLFDRAGFADGDKVPQETFYALLLDGDLYNDGFPNGINISSVPNRVLVFVEDEVRRYRIGQASTAGAEYLSEVFDKVTPQFKDPSDALSAASWLWILRHLQR